MHLHNTPRRIPVPVIIILTILFISFFTTTILLATNKQKIDSQYKETQAVITLIDQESESYWDGESYVTESYTIVYVTYEVGGVEYKDVEYDYYDITMKEGKTIDILYNINDPYIIKNPNSSIILLIIFAVISTGLLIASTVLISKYIQYKKLCKLTENNNIMARNDNKNTTNLN